VAGSRLLWRKKPILTVVIFCLVVYLEQRFSFLQLYSIEGNQHLALLSDNSFREKESTRMQFRQRSKASWPCKNVKQAVFQ
jgi:hypothetical protein